MTKTTVSPTPINASNHSKNWHGQRNIELHRQMLCCYIRIVVFDCTMINRSLRVSLTLSLSTCVYVTIPGSRVPFALENGRNAFLNLRSFHILRCRLAGEFLLFSKHNNSGSCVRRHEIKSSFQYVPVLESPNSNFWRCLLTILYNCLNLNWELNKNKTHSTQSKCSRLSVWMKKFQITTNRRDYYLYVCKMKSMMINYAFVQL